jgi:hypothetical protein
MRFAEQVVSMGEKKNAYRVLVRKRHRKNLFGKPRGKLEHNISINLKEQEGKAWSALIWLSIETNGGLL